MEIFAAAIAAFDTDEMDIACTTVRNMAPTNFQGLCQIAEFSGLLETSHDLVCAPPNTPKIVLDKLTEETMWAALDDMSKKLEGMKVLQ